MRSEGERKLDKLWYGEVKSHLGARDATFIE
jgi:hypothetical protein